MHEIKISPEGKLYIEINGDALFVNLIADLNGDVKWDIDRRVLSVPQQNQEQTEQAP